MNFSSKFLFFKSITISTAMMLGVIPATTQLSVSEESTRLNSSVKESKKSNLKFTDLSAIQRRKLMSNYFQNLYSMPKNISGTCASIGLGMMLGFNDTFFDDNIVPDNLLVKNIYNSKYHSNYVINKLLSFSPGTYDDYLDIMTKPSSSWGEYLNLQKSIKDKSLVAHLIQMEREAGFLQTPLSSYSQTAGGLTDFETITTLEMYLTDRGYIQNQDYTIEKIGYSDANKVEWIKDKIDNGYPLLFMALQDTDKGTQLHANILYDYNQYGYVLNNGYQLGGNSSYPYDRYFNSAYCIKFNSKLTETNNYETSYVDDNGQVISKGVSIGELGDYISGKDITPKGEAEYSDIFDISIGRKNYNFEKIDYNPIKISKKFVTEKNLTDTLIVNVNYKKYPNAKVYVYKNGSSDVYRTYQQDRSPNYIYSITDANKSYYTIKAKLNNEVVYQSRVDVDNNAPIISVEEISGGGKKISWNVNDAINSYYVDDKGNKVILNKGDILTKNGKYRVTIVDSAYNEVTTEVVVDKGIDFTIKDENDKSINPNSGTNNSFKIEFNGDQEVTFSMDNGSVQTYTSGTVINTPGKYHFIFKKDKTVYEFNLTISKGFYFYTNANTSTYKSVDYDVKFKVRNDVNVKLRVNESGANAASYLISSTNEGGIIYNTYLFNYYTVSSTYEFTMDDGFGNARTVKFKTFSGRGSKAPTLERYYSDETISPITYTLVDSDNKVVNNYDISGNNIILKDISNGTSVKVLKNDESYDGYTNNNGVYTFTENGDYRVIISNDYGNKLIDFTIYKSENNKPVEPNKPEKPNDSVKPNEPSNDNINHDETQLGYYVNIDVKKSNDNIKEITFNGMKTDEYDLVTIYKDDDEIVALKFENSSPTPFTIISEGNYKIVLSNSKETSKEKKEFYLQVKQDNDSLSNNEKNNLLLPILISTSIGIFAIALFLVIYKIKKRNKK